MTSWPAAVREPAPAPAPGFCPYGMLPATCCYIMQQRKCASLLLLNVINS